MSKLKSIFATVTESVESFLKARTTPWWALCLLIAVPAAKGSWVTNLFEQPSGVATNITVTFTPVDNTTPFALTNGTIVYSYYVGATATNGILSPVFVEVGQYNVTVGPKRDILTINVPYGTMTNGLWALWTNAASVTNFPFLPGVTSLVGGTNVTVQNVGPSWTINFTGFSPGGGGNSNYFIPGAGIGNNIQSGPTGTTNNLYVTAPTVTNGGTAYLSGLIESNGFTNIGNAFISGGLNVTGTNSISNNIPIAGIVSGSLVSGTILSNSVSSGVSTLVFVQSPTGGGGGGATGPTNSFQMIKALFSGGQLTISSTNITTNCGFAIDYCASISQGVTVWEILTSRVNGGFGVNGSATFQSSWAADTNAAIISILNSNATTLAIVQLSGVLSGSTQTGNIVSNSVVGGVSTLVLVPSPTGGGSGGGGASGPTNGFQMIQTVFSDGQATITSTNITTNSGIALDYGASQSQGATAWEVLPLRVNGGYGVNGTATFQSSWGADTNALIVSILNSNISGGFLSLRGPLVSITQSNYFSPSNIAIFGITTNYVASSSMGIVLSNAWPFTLGSGTNGAVTVSWSIDAHSPDGTVNYASGGNGFAYFTNAPSVGIGVLASNNPTLFGVNFPTTFHDDANATGCACSIQMPVPTGSIVTIMSKWHYSY